MKKNYLVAHFLFALFLLAGITPAAIFTVTNTNNDGAGSLRNAVTQANKTQEEDTIVFDNEVFSTPQTIVLTSGQLYPFYSLVIEGPGTNLLTISGNNQSRIFFSNYFDAQLTIKNLTLTEGFAPNGGAIYATNPIKLSNLLITGNTAQGTDVGPSGPVISLGGGIYSSGQLFISDSVISENLAVGTVKQNTNPNSGYGDQGTAGGGGGIFSYGFEATIVNCTFINNKAQGADSPTAPTGKSGASGGSAYGGAIYGIFAFKVINSRFINNSAVAGNGGSIISNTFGAVAGDGGQAHGGAVKSSGAKILNSSFENNQATAGNGGTYTDVNLSGKGGESKGGGIYDFDLKIANITVDGNIAAAGSGRIGGIGAGGGVFGGSNQWSILNSTITRNSVTGGTGAQTNGLLQGGGVFSDPMTGLVSFFRNNIVAENSASAGKDVFGNFVNANNNLIGAGEGSIGIVNGVGGNLVGTLSSPIDPMLGPLALNGASTQTRALLPGSPAINAGSNAAAINPFTLQSLLYDQRNFQRIDTAGGLIDMGAFEFGVFGIPPAASPDLQNASDTGLNSTDNITRTTMPVFDIPGVIPGATVELLRDNTVVASIKALSFSVSLTDPNPPLDGVVQYTSRQKINDLSSGNSSGLTVTFDHTRPTVTINQADTQSDPASAIPIVFDVVFSELVSGFDQQDISLAGSTADLSRAGIFVNRTSPSTFRVEIHGIGSPGLIVASIPDQAAYDPVINYSSASTSTDNSVIFQPNVLGVSVSGRVIRTSGLIKTPSTVTFIDTFTGETWTARTNPFGFYRFAGLPIYEQIGRRFSIRIDNKKFFYNTLQPVNITGSRSNLNFFVQ